MVPINIDPLALRGTAIASSVLAFKLFSTMIVLVSLNFYQV